MAKISFQQIYDLLLDILRDMAELGESVDELLFDMKALNQELRLGGEFLVPQARPT
jgi:hypothetical protein